MKNNRTFIILFTIQFLGFQIFSQRETYNVNVNYKKVIELVYKKYFNNLDYQNLDISNDKDLVLEKEFIETGIFKFNNHFWPSKIEKFNEWMLKVNSIYYANNEAMTKAYNKINNEEI